MSSLISLRKDENEKEGNYNVAKSELDILLSTEQKENCLLEQLEQKYNSATAGLGDKKAKLEEHSKAIPKLKKKIPELEQDVKRYNNEYEQISKKCNNKEYKIFKQVISEIIREKKQALEDDKEMKELETLMAIAEENDQEMDDDDPDNSNNTLNTSSKGNASTPEISEDDLYD